MIKRKHQKQVKEDIRERERNLFQTEGWGGMSVYVDCNGGGATSKEVKPGTTQTRLFDIDKFCLFRVTGGCVAKIIGPFAGWRDARSCVVVQMQNLKCIQGS